MKQDALHLRLLNGFRRRFGPCASVLSRPALKKHSGTIGWLPVIGLLAGAPSCRAGNTAMDWFSAGAGGGISESGTIVISGTAGQWAADSMSNGSTSLLGGFWSAADPAFTLLTLRSSSNPAPPGSNVSFTAILDSDSDLETPSETVQFIIDGSAFGAPVPLTNGVANVATSSLTPGVHTVAAHYSGDDYFLAATGQLSPGQSIDSVPLPTITAQPSSQTGNAGASATFSVTAQGTPPLRYQWLFNSATIDNATNRTLTIVNEQQSEAGAYAVVVADVFGQITSDSATLTIVDTAPVILTQPAGKTAGAGKSISFTVSSTGADPRSYQWRFGGSDIPGATAKNFTLSNPQSDDAGIYSVLISNALGSVLSSGASLTVTNASPAITAQPTGRTVNAGASATFSVASSGTDPKTFQWMFNGADIPNANAATYTRSNVQQADAGAYSVQVSNGFGAVRSGDAMLAVTDVIPKITGQPQKQTNFVGTSVTFSINVTGTAPFLYQWKWNGTNIIGAISASYTIDNVVLADAGNYSVAVQNALGSAVSANALLTVNAPAAIVQQPQDLQVNAGSGAVFSVAVTGSSPLHYQWYFNGAEISGATKSTYTRAKVQQADVGYYSVVVSNLFGVATSQEALLSVLDPVILKQPLSLTSDAGTTATFRVTVAGSAPFSYQWRFNGADLPGANSATLNRANIQQNMAGIYSVAVTNAYGSAVSDGAQLAVNDIAPVITAQPGGATVDAGSNASFTVRATGTTPLRYQWYFAGVAVDGATNATYNRVKVQHDAAGTYYALVTNTIGSTPSSGAILTVVDIPPVITAQPQSRTNSASTSAAFSIRVNGTSPFGFQWYKDGLEIAGATSSNYTRLNVHAEDQGNYQAVVTNAAGSTVSAIAYLTVDSTFVPVAGAYNGLFYEDAAVNHQSSGFIALNATEVGSFSGTLLIDGSTNSLSGQFDPSGAVTKTIARANLNPLTIFLQLDLANHTDQLSGQVSDGNWTSSLLADRNVFNAVTNPAGYAGSYTLVTPGAADAVLSPGGHGYGIATVDTGGLLKLTGTLGDGSAFSQNVAVSKNGDWPLYAGLYGGKGSILSWIKVGNSSTGALSGKLSWIKTAIPGDLFYPAGFTNEVAIIGSGYAAPSTGLRALDFTNGVVIAEDGNLAQSLTNGVTLKTNNTVTLTAPNASKWKMTLTPKTGAMTGSFVDPATGQTNAFKGVLLQNANYGLGYFLGTNQSGAIFFGP